MKTEQQKNENQPILSMKQVLLTWLPLLGSWMMMSIEMPAINAILARLANPEVNMAAYGGVVITIAMLIASPTIMLLAGSTALCRDWQSYQKLQKYTLYLGGGLSAIHLIIAVTPIYDLIVNSILQVPPELVEPGRNGLIFMTFWSLCISYRRFQQGAMIRFGHSSIVGEVTIVRLVTVSLMLTIGMVVKTIPGTVLAGLTQGMGVALEAIYAGIRVRKIRPEIKAAPPEDEELTFKRFIRFYIPLALTSMMTMFIQPLTSGAISRMPDPIESLAVWSVVSNISNMFRMVGVAYNEVVVALLDKPGSYVALRRFARISSVVMTIIMVLFTITPLSTFLFSYVYNLAIDKVDIARVALSIGIPTVLLNIYLSFFQGIIVNRGRTRVVAEAVAIYLFSLMIVLVVGVITGSYKGIYVASASWMVGLLLQVTWLMWRSRKQRRVLALEN